MRTLAKKRHAQDALYRRSPRNTPAIAFGEVQGLAGEGRAGMLVEGETRTVVTMGPHSVSSRPTSALSATAGARGKNGAFNQYKTPLFEGRFCICPTEHCAPGGTKKARQDILGISSTYARCRAYLLTLL